MKSAQPVVTIVCITYNHEKYLAQALDGFLNQKTSFPVEILVHDDASTDGTVAILKRYAAAHANIRLVLEKQNQFSQGKDDFIAALYAQAQGTYIALCEGDDYWSDPEKLQLQVDFLEKHQDYSLCFHPVRVFFDDQSQPDAIYPTQHSASDFTTEKLLTRNFIQSNSVMYRARKDISLPSGVIPLDWYTHLYYAQFGKIGFINKVMAAYRRHPGGIWWDTARGNIDEIWKKYGLAHLRLFVEVGRLHNTKPAYVAINLKHIVELYEAIIRTDKKYSQDQLQAAITEFPEATKSFILESTQRHQKAISDLVEHANEQAKIITHQVEKSNTLASQLAYYQQHPLKSSLKHTFGKNP